MERGGARVLVDVELDDLHLPPAFLRRLLQRRSHRAAGAAPGRPEVHQHRDGAVLHLALPGRVRRGHGLFGEDALLAAPAARVVPQAAAGDAVLGSAMGAGILDAVVVHLPFLIIAGEGARARCNALAGAAFPGLTARKTARKTRRTR